MRSGKKGDLLSYIIMLLPGLLIYTLIIVAMIEAVHLGFFRWDGIRPKVFVGFGNYLKMFQEERFLVSIRNIFILMGATIVFQVGLGIILAYTMKMTTKLEIFKPIVFLPVIISNVAVVAFFIQFFAARGGYLNYFLSIFGAAPVNWFGLGNKEILVAIVPQTWQYIGLMFVIVLAGFSSVPDELLDAATLDGLNNYQLLVNIYIPLSWDTINVCVILAMVGPLKNFVHIWLFNQGGSDQLSHIPGTLMYLVGFYSFNFGYGSSIAIFILLAAGGMTFAFRSLLVREHT
jgi:raffinose/stachyose/melibiose transport system permease protein